MALGMVASTCIYCRKSSAHPFPKEHVLPKAFGRFRDNLTLQCVCGECNSFFDRELELFLTRDTVEAALRVRYGVKTKSGSRRLGKQRLDFRVISAGDWYGARLTVQRDHTGKSFVAEPMPQVAFRRNDETDWKWFLEDQLTPQIVAPYLKDTETKVVGPRNGTVHRLYAKLDQLGIKFKARGALETHTPTLETFLRSTIDEVIFRAVAKIAFNFLAYVKGGDFALRDDFDGMRTFIRHGVAPAQPPVLVTDIPILNGDNAVYRQTYGHIIVVSWDQMNQGLVCLLSLFNHMTYHVRLCPAYSGIWHPFSLRDVISTWRQRQSQK